MTYIGKLVFQFKNIFVALFSLLGSFFIPIQPLIVVTTLMALLDWVVKIYCILRVEGWAGVKSDRMQDTFYKIIIYAQFVGVLFIVDMIFIKPLCGPLIAIIFNEGTAEWMSKISLATIGTLMVLFREFKSLDENLEMGFGFSPLKIITENFSFLFKWKK